MDSQTIVDAYGAKLKGQQLLFPDPDYVLRNTKFKSIDPKFDRLAVRHWWMNVYIPCGLGDTQTPQNVFNSWGRAHDIFKYILVTGYNSQTNQSAFKTMFRQSDPIDPQYEEFMFFLEETKSNPDGGFKISLLEHTLSGHGSYHLRISRRIRESDPVISNLVITRWSRQEVLRSFDSLFEACKYIRDHHYYQD